jgi:signal transduction histidine kinase
MPNTPPLSPSDDTKKIIDQLVAQTQELLEKNKALEEARSQISSGWYELEKEKARLTASINSLPLGFILTGNSENAVVINPTASYILGLDPNTPVTLVMVEKALEKACDLHQLHERTRSENLPFSLDNLSLGDKFIRLFIAPITIPGSGKDYVGSVILIEDITAARNLDRARDEFFSIASHELRTPLTAIRGNSAMIQKYYQDKLPDATIGEMISDIHESSVRLIKIVNDFLDVSRLEQGRTVYKKEPFEIYPVVNEVVSELYNTAFEKHLNLTITPPTQTLPPALADRDKVKQVIINLVSNAIKYTDTGSIIVSTQLISPFIKVGVTDTGRGIPSAQQSLLFHKFQQAGASLYTRDTAQSTGLGLYISKHFISDMGGSLLLEQSEEGKGSTFSFTIPIAVAS